MESYHTDLEDIASSPGEPVPDCDGLEQPDNTDSDQSDVETVQRGKRKCKLTPVFTYHELGKSTISQLNAQVKEFIPNTSYGTCTIPVVQQAPYPHPPPSL